MTQRAMNFLVPANPDWGINGRGWPDHGARCQSTTGHDTSPGLPNARNTPCQGEQMLQPSIELAGHARRLPPPREAIPLLPSLINPWGSTVELACLRPYFLLLGLTRPPEYIILPTFSTSSRRHPGVLARD